MCNANQIFRKKNYFQNAFQKKIIIFEGKELKFLVLRNKLTFELHQKIHWENATN